jgi:hypothetical protein
MLASGTGLSWSMRFGIVQGIAHQSAAQAGEQQHRATVDRSICAFIPLAGPWALLLLGVLPELEGGDNNSGRDGGTGGKADSKSTFGAVE